MTSPLGWQDRRDCIGSHSRFMPLYWPPGRASQTGPLRASHPFSGHSLLFLLPLSQAAPAPLSVPTTCWRDMRLGKTFILNPFVARLGELQVLLLFALALAMHPKTRKMHSTPGIGQLVFPQSKHGLLPFCFRNPNQLLPERLSVQSNGEWHRRRLSGPTKWNQPRGSRWSLSSVKQSQCEVSEARGC